MDIVQVLSGLGSLALIVGIGIGLVQLRGLRTQRQEELVIRAYSPFLDTALTRAYWRIHTWDFETFADFKPARQSMTGRRLIKWPPTSR